MKYGRYLMFGRPKLQRNVRYCRALADSYVDLDRPLSQDLIPYTSCKMNSRGQIWLRRNKILKQNRESVCPARECDNLGLFYKIKYIPNTFNMLFSDKIKWDRRDEYNFRF